ncbi:MAG: hypothetical protein HC836_48685 [Richelia sp. RM2_1_2]|nr:hypothetical protein [Richelia sp. RM2_1_2]
MRSHEWKKYKEKIQPVLAKCCRHEMYNDAQLLIQEIDRYFRFNLCINYYSKQNLLEFVYYNKSSPKSKLNYDKVWIENKIKIKIAELEDLILLIKLGI